MDCYEEIMKKIENKSKKFYLTYTPEIKAKKNMPKIKKNKYKLKNITYEEYEKINQKHNIYISNILKNLDVNDRLKYVSRMELIGSKLIVNGKVGIVIEERENIIYMIFLDQKIRIYLKNCNEFVFIYENTKYIFLKGLKKNRHYKKVY